MDTMPNIYVNVMAGLGNNMFQVALGEYLKTKGYNVKYFFLKNEPHDGIKEKLEYFFPGIHMDWIDASELDNIPENTEYQSVIYKPLDLSQDTKILGFRQSPKYWDDDMEFIQKLFGPRDIYISKIKQLYPDIDFGQYVSIHVRTYSIEPQNTYEAIRRNIGILDWAWYEKAMSLYSDDTKFVVLSDNIELCKQYLPQDKCLFLDRKTEGYDGALIDLYIPSLCKGNIISNSTFGWWGAYFNTNSEMIVAPKRFFRNIDGYDIFPENKKWILLESRYEIDWPLHMNVISNDCISGFIYKHYNSPYNNPFIWSLIRLPDFMELYKNYDTIDYNNVKHEQHRSIYFTFSTPTFLIDDKIRAYYIHYAQLPQFDTLSKDERWQPNVLFHKDIFPILQEKYDRRLLRMASTSPVFIYNQQEEDTAEDLQKLLDTESDYPLLVITTEKTLKVNSPNRFVIHKDNIGLMVEIIAEHISNKCRHFLKMSK